MRITVDSNETLSVVTAVFAAASKKEYPGNPARELNIAEIAAACSRSLMVEPPKKEPKEDSPKGKTKV